MVEKKQGFLYGVLRNGFAGAEPASVPPARVLHAVRLPPALEKGFHPEGSHFPPTVRCFSTSGTGRGGETSSGFGRAGVFPAPRRGRAGLPLISRLLPAGHRTADLSVLVRQEGGGTHGSPPPPPPPKGRAVRHGGGVRSPHVPGSGGTPQHPPGMMGRGWAGGEPSTRGGQEGAGTPLCSNRGRQNLKMGVQFG